MPTFALNFSRPGAQVVAQYYNFLRLGFEGYQRVQGYAREVATRLAAQIAELGPFELITRGDELPVFAFTLRETSTTTPSSTSRTCSASGAGRCRRTPSRRTGRTLPRCASSCVAASRTTWPTCCSPTSSASCRASSGSPRRCTTVRALQGSTTKSARRGQRIDHAAARRGSILSGALGAAGPAGYGRAMRKSNRPGALTSLDVKTLLASVEAAPPIDAAEVVAAALADALGARDVSFLIADYSGRALVRLSHVHRASADDDDVNRERGQSVALAGTPHGRALTEQETQIVPDFGGIGCSLL